MAGDPRGVSWFIVYFLVHTMSAEISINIDNTCNAIGRYYVSLGKSYQSVFSSFCGENGLDETALESEMEVDVEQSLLSDFDWDNFPFKTELVDDKSKKQFIHNLVRKCLLNPDITFGSAIPAFFELGSALFELERKEIDAVANTYASQCPDLWNNEWATDFGFLTLLAVGRKRDFDYLLHLVDDYTRHCIKNIHTAHTGIDPRREWASSSHKHFRQLSNVKIMVNNNQKKYEQLVISAVDSFNKRVCPPLLFNPMKCINDSLESVVYYILNAVRFVCADLLTSSSKSMQAVCPFQVDVCILSDEPIRNPN
eukprot:982550_1